MGRCPIPALSDPEPFPVGFKSQTPENTAVRPCAQVPPSVSLRQLLVWHVSSHEPHGKRLLFPCTSCSVAQDLAPRNGGQHSRLRRTCTPFGILIWPRCCVTQPFSHMGHIANHLGAGSHHQARGHLQRPYLRPPAREQGKQIWS